MAQGNVGDRVRVHGLARCAQYNGHYGVVQEIIGSFAENKCKVKLVDVTEEKYLILKLHCLHFVPPPPDSDSDNSDCVDVTGLGPGEFRPARPIMDSTPSAAVLARPKLCWGSAENRIDYYDNWKGRVACMDPSWLHRGKDDVYLYLILKLAHLMRSGNKIGPATWMFRDRQVNAIHYGCVWGHGGKEQEEPLPIKDTEIQMAGSQWWPIIWVEPRWSHTNCVDKRDWLLPVYCPGLAWQSARPWFAHPSRVQEVETPGVIIDELKDWMMIEEVRCDWPIEEV